MKITIDLGEPGRIDLDKFEEVAKQLSALSKEHAGLVFSAAVTAMGAHGYEATALALLLASVQQAQERLRAILRAAQN